jgi:hypothetical protein
MDGHRPQKNAWTTDVQSVAIDELALGADEAGLLGCLLAVEPNFGHGAAIAR